MFASLSPDLSLTILSYLPLCDVSRLYLLSKRARHFLIDHEDAVYHQLAVLHRYAVLSVALKDAIAVEMRAGGYHLHGVQTWKDYCRESVLFERNWAGRGVAYEGAYSCFDSDVQQFQIVEEHGLILTRSTRGVVAARALSGLEVLWSLSDVTNFAQSGQFLLIWREEDSGDIEIWRLVSSNDGSSCKAIVPLTPPSPLAATKAQIEAYEASSISRSRSRVVPHGCLQGGGSSDYALYAPRLAVVDEGQIHVIRVYNLLSGELSQAVDLQTCSHSGDLYNVPSSVGEVIMLQLSGKYLLASHASGLTIVRLGGAATASGENGVSSVVAWHDHWPCFGGDMWSLHFRNAPCYPSPRAEVDAGNVVIQEHSTFCRIPSTGALLEVSKIFPEDSKEVREEATRVYQLVRLQGYPRSYLAASFSPDGRHLLIGSFAGVLYFFPDVDRLFRGTATPDEIIQKLFLCEAVHVIQWAPCSRRFVVQTGSKQILLVDLCPDYHNGEYGSEPGLELTRARVMRVRHFTDRFSRLRSAEHQLTRTGLWLVSEARVLHRDIEQDLPELEDELRKVVAREKPHKTICYIKFTRNSAEQEQ